MGHDDDDGGGGDEMMVMMMMMMLMLMLRLYSGLFCGSKSCALEPRKTSSNPFKLVKESPFYWDAMG
jgi:hypothetical protein